MATDKQLTAEASEYLIDPVRAPVPSEETGLNAHFGSIGKTATPPPGRALGGPATAARPSNNTTSTTNGAASNANGTTSTANGTTSTANGTTSNANDTTSTTNDVAASPSSSSTTTASTNPFRRNAPYSRSTHNPASRGHRTRHSATGHATAAAAAADDAAAPNHRRQVSEPSAASVPRRSTSLTSRFPGDRTHRPLAMLAREARLAERSPHLSRRHHPGPDTIDQLDALSLSADGGVSPTGAYHHEGPYDAALLARNLDSNSSPLAAVAGGNAAALRATPADSIRDSIARHRPLDHTASVPPGVPDRLGRVLHYDETDVMHEEGEHMGRYKQWDGVDYDEHDRKGKGLPGGWEDGEEGARERWRRYRAARQGGGKGHDEAIELPEREGGATRTGGETAKLMGGELRKRIGSLKGRKRDAD